MADASLDDFFAKKDKSKKKSKSSKVTPGDILAKSDEPVKKEKKSKKDKENTQTSSEKTDSGTPLVTEEKWKDVEEEVEKDYSGLRIANLQISEKEVAVESEDGGENAEGDEDEDGETVREKKDPSGQKPWRPSDGGKAQEKSAPVVEDAPPPAKEEPKTGGKYISPGMRAAAAAGTTPGGPTVPSHLRRKKNAPNLRSEEEFPTLGGGAPQGWPNDGDSRSFERVQSGGRHMDDPNKPSQQVSTGNKFSALQD